MDLNERVASVETEVKDLREDLRTFKDEIRRTLEKQDESLAEIKQGIVERNTRDKVITATARIFWTILIALAGLVGYHWSKH